MQWFYNMKIATKLIVSFIIVALISGIVGVVGVINIQKMDELDSDMYQRYTATMPDLANVARAYQRERVALRNMYIEQNPNTVQTLIDEVMAQRQIVTDSLNNFEASIEDTAVRETFDALSARISDFDVFSDEIISAIKANQVEVAHELLTGSRGAQIATDIQTLTDELFNLRVENARKAAENNSNTANRAVITMVAVILSGVLLAVLLGIFISRLISNPVKKMVEATDKLAQGDFSITVEADSKDEIGQLAEYLNRMIEQNNEVLANIASASEQVASGSKQVSDSSISLSQGATEQASSIEQLTASLEEISSQTKHNAENANQANDLAENAKSNAVLGNNQMQEMLKSMEEINESSANISKIIKVIDEIAFQTNILALNAAVEAARAGQHGKGFAVVAEEVRNLAARSANAAKETTDLIEGSIRKVEDGTKIAKDTAEALNEIVNGIEKVAALVSDIAVASNEQATGIEQINQGVMQVSQVVQSNSAISEESAAASEELSGQAALLEEMVGRFKLRHQRKSVNNINELNPQVLAMLDNMGEKKKNSLKPAPAQEQGENPNPQMEILLSDKEFGKY